jgi:hypothetical protein
MSWTHVQDMLNIVFGSGLFWFVLVYVAGIVTGILFMLDGDR